MSKSQSMWSSAIKDSPVTGLAFLIGLILVPAVISCGVAWGVLRLTDTGVLFYRAEVMEPSASHDADSGNTKKMLHCSYFTGTRVVERKFSYEDLPYNDDTGLRRKGSCPWWINVP